MSVPSSLWTAARAIVFAGLFWVLWVWLAYEARQAPPPFGIRPPGWTAPIGFALMPLGALLAIACVATFVVLGRGTPAPFDPPREFVGSGPYRWVRNPMYLGFFVFLVGYALCAVSFGALLVAFGMLAAAHLFTVLYEEPALERRFGESYREYRRTTRRWIPRRPRP
ncbi:MAG TPA: methyltransferase [Gemmatimonadota bacterium]|jgi:protein-S-isoprenylcysteine O-methyltransferase Ste14